MVCQLRFPPLLNWERFYELSRYDMALDRSLPACLELPRLQKHIVPARLLDGKHRIAKADTLNSELDGSG